VFVNEKLEVIETINKRVSNGRYVYSSNSRERAANRATVNIIGNKQNAIPFGTLYFANSKIMISPEGRKQLDAVVEYLTRNAMSKVYLVAHSDLLESIDYRNEMSDKRAKAAGDYIVSKGIDRKRITRKGFFEANPGKRVLGEPLPGEESENSRRVDIYIKDN
jgi:outer membrane protein OmpA-like peptidoglycan-associated protein